ncbi:MAG: hypothetical protein HY812_14165, partial [Planctomycetes bacterium]|nr:hypothetical protein [Planctomycetota bacterium]
MSRLRLLCQRLLERRLLGDGEQAAALVPGALLTLSLSLLLFTAIVQARSLQDSVTLLCIACCVWCATRAFLESHDLAAASLDRAVLEPLPLPRWTLAAARAVVVASVLLISALNIALPAAILVAVKWGPDRGVLALAGALLSALTGLALAQACRVLLERLAGGERLLELEGPIRLGVGVALFGVLFSAPDPTALAAERPWLESLPPFSYAALAVAENGRAAAAASALAAATSLFLLLLTFRLAAARAGGGARRAPR